MNNKGQSVFSEYALVIFIVIAAAVAITTYASRALQGRIHDARDFAAESLVSSGACDANCLLATGATNNQIPTEYEPYYAQTVTDVFKNEAQASSLSPSANAAFTDISQRTSNETTNSITMGVQLPPGCADGVNPKPSYCGDASEGQ